MNMNKEQPVTLTLGEIDSTLFETLTSEFKAMYPNDHRTALRAAMHVADKVMGQIEPLAARQAKSEMARKAAQARYTAPPQNPGAEPVPGAFATPTAPAAAPVKRPRRSKAQMEADRAALAAAQAMMATASQQVSQQSGVQDMPLGVTTPPAPTNAELTAQAFPAAPPVQDFATLAQQAAAQGVPQFAPANVPPPPTPTFG
jgi:hypothetical protein